MHTSLGHTVLSKIIHSNLFPATCVFWVGSCDAMFFFGGGGGCQISGLYIIWGVCHYEAPSPPCHV